VPISQSKGTRQMIRELEEYLKMITGFDAVSMQPNSGAQGEYAGLMAIRNYFESRDEGHRNSSGQVAGNISVVALSFMVQEPSGIME
jgi:glycine cleavage system protein P-like pyridoxal-binding family